MSSYVEKTRTASQMRRVILRKVNRVLKKQGKRQMSKFFESSRQKKVKLWNYFPSCVIPRTFLITTEAENLRSSLCVYSYRKSSLIRTYVSLICFNWKETSPQNDTFSANERVLVEMFLNADALHVFDITRDLKLDRFIRATRRELGSQKQLDFMLLLAFT